MEESSDLSEMNESSVPENCRKIPGQKRNTVDSGVANSPEEEESYDGEMEEAEGSICKLELPSPDYSAQSSADSGKNSSGISRGSASPEMPDLVGGEELFDAVVKTQHHHVPQVKPPFEPKPSGAEKRGRRRRHDTDEDEESDDLAEVGARAVNAESDNESNSYDCDVSNLLASKFEQKPKHKWSSFASIKRREMGYGSRQSNELFRYKAMGSLHMVERLELMYKMQNHSGCVNCLHFNASGTRLASGSDDTNVTIWDWTTNRSLLTFDTGHTMNVFQAKFMPLSGDCHIVTCARDGQIRLAELSALGVCNATRKLARHSGAAHKLALDLHSPHVFLSCGEDAAVYELDLRDPKPNKLLVCKREEGRKVALYSIHSDPSDSNYFAVSGRDPKCRIYDKRKIVEAATPVKSYCPHHLTDASSPNVTCIMYNHNGSELLATYNDDDIYAFDTSHSDGADYIRRFTGHRNNATVKGVNWFGPNSEFVVSGSDCGHIYFWDRDTQKIVQFLLADEGGVVNCLEPHPTCPVLATSGLDHDVKIWVPSSEDVKFDTTELEKLTKSNMRMRTRDRLNPDPDTDFIYYMLRQIVGRRRRRLRREHGGEPMSGDGDSSADDDDEDNGDETSDSDVDDSHQDRHVAQCRTS